MIKHIRSKKSLFIIFLIICITSSITTGLATEQSIAYHGNTKSKIFHKPDCRYYNCKNCTVQFMNRQEAVDAGYRPCKICKP